MVAAAKAFHLDSAHLAGNQRKNTSEPEWQLVSARRKISLGKKSEANLLDKSTYRRRRQRYNR